jgi:hypothetical protein
MLEQLLLLLMLLLLLLPLEGPLVSLVWYL